MRYFNNSNINSKIIIPKNSYVPSSNSNNFNSKMNIDNYTHNNNNKSFHNLAPTENFKCKSNTPTNMAKTSISKGDDDFLEFDNSKLKNNNKNFKEENEYNEKFSSLLKEDYNIKKVFQTKNNNQNPNKVEAFNHSNYNKSNSCNIKVEEKDIEEVFSNLNFNDDIMKESNEYNVNPKNDQYNSKLQFNYSNFNSKMSNNVQKINENSHINLMKQKIINHSNQKEKGIDLAEFDLISKEVSSFFNPNNEKNKDDKSHLFNNATPHENPIDEFTSINNFDSFQYMSELNSIIGKEEENFKTKETNNNVIKNIESNKDNLNYNDDIVWNKNPMYHQLNNFNQQQPIYNNFNNYNHLDSNNNVKYTGENLNSLGNNAFFDANVTYNKNFGNVMNEVSLNNQNPSNNPNNLQGNNFNNYYFYNHINNNFGGNIPNEFKDLGEMISSFLQNEFNKKPNYIINSKDITFEKQIGFGGTSEVYKGVYRGSDVAIKKLRIFDIKDEKIKEFKREVCSLSLMRHPSLVLFMGAM